MNLPLSYETGAKLLKAVLASLLASSAVLGGYILATDSYLWAQAPSHAYGLIAFVAMDLAGAAVLFVRPTLSRLLAPVIPLVQLSAMVGDLYTGLGSPGSAAQYGLREYLLNDSAFMALLILQAVLVGLASGYLVQRPVTRADEPWDAGRSVGLGERR